MQQLLSVILSVAILLTSLCGSFAGLTAEQPLSGRVGLRLEGDPSALNLSVEGVSLDTPEKAKILLDLISILSLRFAISGSAAEVDVLLNETSVASMAAQQQEAGWSVVSSLFPASVLTISNDSLQPVSSSGPVEAAPSQDPAPAGQDLSFLPEVILAPVMEMMAALESKAGTPESGSFTVDGEKYTAKVPYDITAAELVELFITAAKKIAGNEQVASLLKQIAPDFSADSLDKVLESMDRDNMPALTAAVYRNDAGASCSRFTLAKEDQSMDVILGLTGGVISKIKVNIFNQLAVALLIDQETKKIDLDLTFAQNGTAVGLKGSITAGESNTGVDLTVAVTKDAKTVTVGIVGSLGHEAPSFSAEGKTAYALETLLADEDAATAFSGQLTAGLFSLLGKAMQEFPEIATLMTPAATEAPAPADSTGN